MIHRLGGCWVVPVVLMGTVLHNDETLVLVFVIDICCGGWLSVSAGLSHHRRCGALGLFPIVFRCSRSFRLLCKDLNELV